MSMYALLRSKPEAPTEEEIEEALAGNLWWGYLQPHLSDAFTPLKRVTSEAH